jgi:hypothetical protein
MEKRRFCSTTWTLVLLVATFALLASGCAMTFTEKKLPALPAFSRAELPLDESIRLERFDVTERKYQGEANGWQQGLAEKLRRENIFENVVSPKQKHDSVDLILRGEIRADFGGSGFLNFITWFPGPFIFMHNWRGTRFNYDVTADLELVDAQTGEVVGEYLIEASKIMAHRSSNPGPMFGALLIIPGVVKGAISANPRYKYRTTLYEKVYADLWRHVAAEIAIDRSQEMLFRRDALRERCGARFNAGPVIGTSWSEFVDCQERKFYFTGEESTSNGPVRLYQKSNSPIRIGVTNDEIHSWVAE